MDLEARIKQLEEDNEKLREIAQYNTEAIEMIRQIVLSMNGLPDDDGYFTEWAERLPEN